MLTPPDKARKMRRDNKIVPTMTAMTIPAMAPRERPTEQLVAVQKRKMCCGWFRLTLLLVVGFVRRTRGLVVLVDSGCIIGLFRLLPVGNGARLHITILRFLHWAWASLKKKV